MSGEAPFHGLHQSVILRRVVQHQPPKPVDHQKLPETDPLWELMRSCWSEDPTARPTMRKVLTQVSLRDSSPRPNFELRLTYLAYGIH